MKSHLAPSLLALSICAVLGSARAAHAQGMDATLPAVVDSVVALQQPERSLLVPGTVVATADLAPVIRPSLMTLAQDVRSGALTTASRDVAAIQGRSWKMPASRTLMIGGTALAIVGLVAVKGDAGAIMGLAGGGIAVYGLYLHYNR